MFFHQLSNYRSHVTPSQYQSDDLNLIISRYFAITVMKNHEQVYGRPSHVILKMTLSQVYQLWSFVLLVLERNMSQNILNTCKILILLYHWIWRIWYKRYPADTINIHHTSFSILRPRLTTHTKTLTCLVSTFIHICLINTLLFVMDQFVGVHAHIGHHRWIWHFVSCATFQTHKMTFIHSYIQVIPHLCIFTTLFWVFHFIVFLHDVLLLGTSN